MKSYDHNRKAISHVFEKKQKASNQPPIDIILQRYNENPLKENIENKNLFLQKKSQNSLLPDKNTTADTGKDEVLQRQISQEFERNVLNVVGETHHNVSRGAECEFLSRYGFSSDFYYQEHELGMDGHKLKPQSLSSTSIADPALLRALEIVSLVDDSIIKYEDSFRNYEGLKVAKNKAELLKDKWKLFEIKEKIEETKANLGSYIMIISEHINKAMKYQLNLCKTIFEEKMRTRSIDKGSIHIIIELIEYTDKIQFDNIANLKIKNAYIRDRLLNVTEINFHAFEPEEKSFTSQITATRSYYMHEAANILNDNGIKGLWKIGNSHVIDIIRNKEKLNIRYNLIHQDDFEKILQKHGLGQAILYKTLSPKK